MSTDRSVCKWRLCVSHILLLYCCRYVNGVVDISPSAVAAVCRVGDQLELTCNTSNIFLRWEFTVYPENMTLTTTPLTSVGTSGVPPPLTLRNSMFTFSRLSGPNVLPLISKTTVPSVSSGLNGTVVSCFEGSSATESVATTTIRIIDSGQFELSIQSHSEEFLRDGVTVNLEWTLLNSQSYYQQFLRNISVSADQQLNNVIFTGNMNIQLTLSYNTLYNVRITQNSVCQPLIRTISFERIYSKCSDPMELTDAIALGYEDPALEGQSITFTCASSLILSGPNTSTCMGNGEWEPDPREVECTGSGTPIITSDNRTLEPVEVDCMVLDTCVAESSTTNPTLGIVLGVVFGIIFIAIIAIVATLIFIFNKKRLLKLGNDASTRYPKHVLNTSIELDTHGDNHSSNLKDEEALVYADIGQRPAPARSKINTHLLDDNRVEYALLDHFAHEQKAQESSAANNSDNYPSVNLDNLLIQLRPQVGPKWYQFGEAAGIDKEALDKIAEQCRTPDECIVELFDHWLRFSAEPPTWKSVANILKAIKLNELGLDIERVYITGTLPIVVDMNVVPKLDSQEEEPPPPLPARSGNLYIDTPSHSTSQRLTEARAAPPPSNEMSAPALPPKPPRNKSANISAAQSNPNLDWD